MHAPLGVPERQLACADLISALNECHAQGMIYRFAGKCNVQKQALTMCLRKERIDRTTRNREQAKERTMKKDAAWADLDREEATGISSTSGQETQRVDTEIPQRSI